MHAALAVWSDALDAPDWDGEPARFHGDLHEGNLLVNDGRLGAVIDWGEAGCGDPAIELMTEDYPGLVEVYENWNDGEKGGWTVKPSFAQASRRFEAASRADLEAGSKELTAIAVAEGWVEDTPGDSPFRFLAFNEFPACEGLLGVEISTVDGAKVLTVDYSVNN